MSHVFSPVTAEASTLRLPSRSTSPPNGGVLALMNLPTLCLAGARHSIGISSPTNCIALYEVSPQSCSSHHTQPATPKNMPTSALSAAHVAHMEKLQKSPCLFEIEEVDDNEIATLATIRPVQTTAPTTGQRSTASWLAGGPSTTALDSARRSAALSGSDGRFSASAIRRGGTAALATSASQHRGATPAIAKQLNFESANVSSRSQPAHDSNTPEARASSNGSNIGATPANYSWAGMATLIDA